MAHTYVFDDFGITPYLGLTSPTPRCGKTTLFRLITAHARKAFNTANATTASIFRLIDRDAPTLLLDEADTYVKMSDDLRGILNSGHAKSSARVVRCVGDNHDVQAFSTWCPKAFALIGHLPPTLQDRSIGVRLRRKPKGLKTEPIDDEDLMLASAAVRADFLRWAQDKRQASLERRPLVPDVLHDRAADNWRPLLAIADDAGGEWPERARVAAVMLSPAEGDDRDIPTMLLLDIREVFAASGESVLYSETLVMLLCERESRPWAEYDRGRPLTPTTLASALGEFCIEPKKIRQGGIARNGYRLEWFTEVFAAYFPEGGEQPEQQPWVTSP